MDFQGAMTAIVTPMQGEKVDYDALDAVVEQQLAGGVSAIVAVGTTGESATLSMRENVEVIGHVVRAVAGRVPVIAGAGANSTAEALELSRASEEAGANALLHVCPYYNKPTQEGLYRHFATIAGKTGLPICLYNVPGRTASDLQPETVARLAELDRIAALKEATGDMRRASDVIELCGDRIAILSGDDFTVLPLMALGGKGVISVISNVKPAEVSELCAAALRGDWERARKIHFDLMPLLRLLFAESNPIPVKAAMEIIGLIKPGIRLPLVPASESLRAQLRKVLGA